MGSDEKGGPLRRPRVIERPRVPPGPLADLKALVYELYLEAGAPSLDEIAAWVAEDDGLAGAPERDTIHRIIRDTKVPPSQADVVAVVTVLARAARWDRHDAAGRARDLWVAARMHSAVGTPLTHVTDPFVLEVHRPVQPEDAPPGLPLLPPYVLREHDQVLGRVVAAAARGRSEIAVLVGGSSVGKTRACWEALALLRNQDPPWRLWHPIDPSRPDAALRELPGIGARTVVWLNEAQFYLDPAEAGLGERVAAGLRELLRDPGRAPVLVLATVWPRFWNALTGRPADGEDRHAQARELLAGHDIAVPAAFTPAQMSQLARAVDVRMALAAWSAPDGAVIQFLAGAPELLARYRNAPPAAAALIHAAMDGRRLGMGAGLPQAFLEAAAPGYLTDDQWDALGEDWPEHALAYTAAPCKGARGPLTRIRSRSRRGDRNNHLREPPAGPACRLADYLDQHGRTRRASQIPPPEFWSAAAAHAVPADQARLAAAAHNRGLYRDAAQIWKDAAARGDMDAAFRLITSLHRLTPADPRPVHWVLTHASLSDPAAHASLGNPAAVARLLDILRQAGADEQVAELASRAAAHADLSDPVPVARLLESMWEAGTADQAAELASRAAAHADLSDLTQVSDLLDNLREAGADEQTAELASRAAAHADLSDPAAVARLLDSLWAAGADEQAAALTARDPAGRTALDDPDGVASLLDSLRRAGADEQVAALAARDPAGRTALDDPIAVARLLDSLRQAGAKGQVAALASRASVDVELSNPAAVGYLLQGLRWVAADEQVAALLARGPAAHADFGDPVVMGNMRFSNTDAISKLLDMLREAGAAEQVSALLARDPAGHASARDPIAVSNLLSSLRQAGAKGQVIRLARRAAAHADLSNPIDVGYLLDSLRWADADEPVIELARRAATHASLSDPGAVGKLLDGFRRAGATEQVAALLTRDPAAHAHFGAEIAVDYLLQSLQKVGAAGQVAALTVRLPAAGMFELFLHQQGSGDLFRYGREADGTPAAPWGWEDLDLWLVPRLRGP